LIGTTPATNYKVTGLLTNSAYNLYVVAVDSTGNISAESNHVLANTSNARLVSSDLLKDQYKRTSGLFSWAFPYASPFGDQNCDPSKLTTTTSDDCVNDCTGSSNCGGSCVIVQPTDTLGNTGACRSMTMQSCPYKLDPIPAYQAVPTLYPTLVDQGVDYSVFGSIGCKYNNPNPNDNEPYVAASDDSVVKSSPPSNAVVNTRIYAMGKGVLLCAAANPGYSENLTLTQYCLNGKGPIGGPGMGTWLVYKLTSPGPGEDLKIYVAEGCNLASNAINDVTAAGGTGNGPGNRFLGRRWKAGDNVTKNSVLCEVSKGTIEMGWADFQYYATTAAYSCFYSLYDKYGNWSTAWGKSFNRFVLKADNDRFSGLPGSNAYGDCRGLRLQDKYKNSAWW